MPKNRFGSTLEPGLPTSFVTYAKRGEDTEGHACIVSAQILIVGEEFCMVACPVGSANAAQVILTDNTNFETAVVQNTGLSKPPEEWKLEDELFSSVICQCMSTAVQIATPALMEVKNFMCGGAVEDMTSEDMVIWYPPRVSSAFLS